MGATTPIGWRDSMPLSKRNISESKIVEEIYNTFELFKKQKSISISEYLKSLNISLFKDRKYRKIKFSYESLAKLYLFQKIKGIKFYTRLTKYLRKNPKDRFRLGFAKTPDRTSIGHFVKHSLNEEEKKQLDFIASKIVEISEKFGIILDIKTLEVEKPVKPSKERNQFIQKAESKNEVSKLLKKRFMPFIDFKIGKNGVFSSKDFVDLLVHLTSTKDFAENGSVTYRGHMESRRVFCPKCHSLMLPSVKIFSDGRCVSVMKCNKCKSYRRTAPNADTFLYHIHKFDDIEKMKKMFDVLFEIIWQLARQANIFNSRMKVNVSIDYTEWFYYGNRNAKMVVGKKPERGAWGCYKFATINIVEPGRRFTLYALPVHGLVKKDKIIEELLSYALKRVRINNVSLDKGFFDTKSILAIERFGLNWFMPAQRYYSIKKTIDLTIPPRVWPNRSIGNVKFNLLVFEKKDDKTGKLKKLAYATNLHFESGDVRLAERVLSLYSKRWGIETSYRVEKQNYMGKTTSKNYKIRFFYFLFSVLLYNLWILADIFVWLRVYGKVGEKHLLRSKHFSDLFMSADDGG